VWTISHGWFDLLFILGGDCLGSRRLPTQDATPIVLQVMTRRLPGVNISEHLWMPDMPVPVSPKASAS
jgi:hypothetical protein